MKKKEVKKLQKLLKKANIAVIKETENKVDPNEFHWFSNQLYKFERWLDIHNHKMELLRTIGSLGGAALSLAVLLRLFGYI